ncbi:MAG TPA: hypothetical protein PLQ81_08100 [bacterium]|nr:hypothetical protein [bacterium]
MKKLAFLLFVCLLSLTFYFELYAKQDKVSRRNIRNVTEVTNKANDGTIEGKNKLDNIITAEPIKLNDNSYYFIKGKKVIELNLKTKEFKEYAEGIKKRQNYWLQVGADGHIYEIKNSELSITNTESASESTDSERGVKSRGSRKNIKSAKQSKYNLKSVDKRGSSSKRGARSAAGETQTDEKITKFSVVAQDGFMYEYDLEKKTTTKKEKFDGEIKTNFIQIIDTNNELEEIDISKLSDSRNGELTNSGEVSADKSNTESGERGVKSRSVRSVEKKTKSNTRKVRSANRGVRSASGEAENAVAEEELSESGLIIVKLKEEYIKLVEAEEKIFTGEAVADKPLVIKKGAEYFYWIEGDIVYEINMAFMRAAEFSKVNFGDKDKWYAVRPDGQIVMFPITAASAEESTDAAGSDRGVRSRATKKVQKKNVKSRSVRSARGAIDAEEYKPVDVPKTEGDNFYFVGKDNSIYLVDRINNEIRRVKEYDGELKTGNICLIFPGGKKVDAPIEELIPEEDEEQIASADDSKRGARSRTARSRQTSKTKIKGKSVKKSARSVKSVNPNCCNFS